jgi:hypothetical protein
MLILSPGVNKLTAVTLIRNRLLTMIEGGEGSFLTTRQYAARAAVSP